MDNNQIRAAGRVAGKMARNAAKGWVPAAKNSGRFVKHVVPAAVKPIHSLWHEVLGFVFLMFSGVAAYRMWQDRADMPPVKFIMISVFVLVTLGYGISSILKARRISRS
ncbi:MAG TPA: hypothetical protein VHA14_14095 [Bryobacteraceae bacterium]|nr:hypothetical protein [Bryobacteraceae bacterium]